MTRPITTRLCVVLIAVIATANLAYGQTEGAGSDASEARASAPQATLYAFFATWCVPCRIELPHIQRFHESYAGRGLKVVLVSEDAPSSAQNIPAFLARFGVTAPWVLDDESELLERYNPSANLPFTVLLDRAGNVAYAHSGYEPGDEKRLEAEILALLKTEEARDALEQGSQTRQTGQTGQATRDADSPAVTRQADRSRLRVRSTTQSLGAYRTSKFDTQSDGTLRAGVGRIEVAGEAGEYRATTRIDGALVSDDADDMTAGNDARLERATLSADLGPVALVAGDDYVSFGHGVTLSLRKVDPLGVDTTLRGARADADFGRLEAKVLAGWTNPQNFDPIELHIVDDQDNDLLAGAEVTIDLGDLGGGASHGAGPVAIGHSGDRSWAGPYALYSRAANAAGDGQDVSWIVGGAATSLSLGSVRVAADAAGGTRDGLAFDETETAWALYSAVQWTGGPITALIDGKAYRHWAIGRGESLLYHEPPTLEREDQEVPNNEDVLGARTRVEWRARERLTVFGNLLGYRHAESGGAPMDGNLALHGYAGGDVRLARGGDEFASAGLAAGYRRETDPDGDQRLALWHIDLDGAWRLPHQLAVTVKWNHRDEVKRVFPDDKSFRRGLAVLGLSRSGWGAISALYGYSTEFDSRPTHYPGGELLVHLPRGGNVRVFVGRLTGGIVCVSGSCRNVPPFSGARLDLSLHL